MQKKLTGRIVGLRVTVVGCLLLVGGSLCAFGQETRASLGGKVTDRSGAVVQKATVVVTADATGVVQTTTTNDAGDWRIQYLLPGTFHFQVSAKGFKTETREQIDLQVNDVKTIDTQLQVGSQAQSITIDTTTPLLDTTAAVSGTVITAAELEELPSETNGPTSAMGLAEGVTMMSTNSSNGPGQTGLWSNGGLSQSEVNGIGSPTGSTNTAPNAPALGYASSFTLDGGNDVNNTGSIGFEPPLDAVAEMKVVTNAYDASIGRASGSTAVLMTRPGTASYHGDLYEYNQNNFLNANSYQFDATHTPKAPVHTNNYGGTLGGPIWIPKLFDGRKRSTFFFFSYTGIRDLAPGATGFLSIPDAAERMGDFSQSYVVSAGVRYPITIYNPNTIVPTTPGNFARTPFQGDMIPAGQIDPVAKAIMALLPLPNTPAQTSVSNDDNNYVEQGEQVNKVDSYMLRVDRAWNNNNHSYISLRQNHWLQQAQDVFGNSFFLGAATNARVNKGITIDHNVILNKNLVLDLNYNLTAWRAVQLSGTAGMNPGFLGFSSNYISQMQVASVPCFCNLISGDQSIGTKSDSNPSEGDVNQDFNGAMTESFRNHTFRYGAEYMIQQQATSALGETGGLLDFGTNWTDATPVGANPTGAGDLYADFLLGLPDGGSLGHQANGYWSQHYFAYYFQDDWRVNKKLTLNLGLRWDYERPVTERFNRFATRYDPGFQIPGVTAASQANYATLVGGSSAGNTGLALLQAERPNASTFVPEGGFLFAGVNGTSRYVENPIKKYFQPRLGFAYQFLQNSVIRGGLGRFVNADFVNGANFQTGYSQTTNLTPTTNNYESAPTISLENPYPNGVAPPIGNSQGEATNFGTFGGYFDPNIGRVYADEASLSVEQQVKSFLFEVGFVLTKSHGLYMSWETNDPTVGEWQQAYDPQFTSTGAPVLTLPGSTAVANPFYHVSGIYASAGDYTGSTISAYSLLRPNPILGSVNDTKGTGATTYYALNSKIERRFKNGFGLTQTFFWSKNESADSFIGPQVVQPKFYRQLSSFDERFHYLLVPIYELPFGRGKLFANHINKLTDELIGGWEFTGQYEFLSGTPLVLPTNTNSGTTPSASSGLFEGGDPTLHKGKSSSRWFNTSMFEPVPTSSTTVAQLANYPAWTGVQQMPGYNWVPTPSVSGYSGINNGIFNDFTTRVTYNKQIWGSIRNPYETNFVLGARKSFAITSTVRLQLGIDAFNALNHPQFGSIDVNPADAGFGAISGSTSPSKWVPVNVPRAVQFRGRITF